MTVTKQQQLESQTRSFLKYIELSENLNNLPMLVTVLTECLSGRSLVWSRTSACHADDPGSNLGDRTKPPNPCSFKENLNFSIANMIVNSMKKIEEIKSKLATHREELKQKYKVKEIGIFGSYVKGKQNRQSDVDILVEFEEPSNLSLIDFIKLENYLSEIVGVKVDLVEKHTLKPRIGKHVLEEVVNV